MLARERRGGQKVSINFIVSIRHAHFVAFTVNGGAVNMCFGAYALQNLGKYCQCSKLYVISRHF